MVTFNTQTPFLLIKRGSNDKIVPVVKAQKISEYNNNRRTNEQKKNDVKTTAVILRISEQGKSQRRTD